MARSYTISQITPSGGVGVPGRIQLTSGAGNVTASFQGKFWLNSTGGTLPGYTPPTPVGYTLIQATSFDITGNASYAGRYTVYSPISLADVGANPSSVFNSPNTLIRVSEVIGVPAVPGDATTGTVTNISTYLIAIAGESPLVVPPTALISDRPIDVVGRNGTPWGEPFIQNFIDLAQNFASGTAPALPYLGQTWYDTTLNEFKLCTDPSPIPTWTTLTFGSPGANTSYRSSVLSGTSWVVNHGLNISGPPFIALTQVFIDVGGGVYKMIIPQDITFTNANSMTITFSSAQTGIVLIRA